MNPPKINFTELARTCYACPSQYEGYTTDGRGVYIRYRYGHFSITLSKEPVPIHDDDFTWFIASKNEDLVELVNTYFGGEYDGYLDELELRAILKKHGLLNQEPIWTVFKWFFRYYKNRLYWLTIGRIQQWYYLKYTLSNLDKK